MNDLPAIVLGIQHPRSITAIRSLAHAGIPVIGVNQKVGYCEFTSRYLVQRHLVERSPDAVLALLDSLGRNGGGVLIPTDDELLI